jgi:hypothetical protein
VEKLLLLSDEQANKVSLEPAYQIKLSSSYIDLDPLVEVKFHGPGTELSFYFVPLHLES